MKCHRIGKYHLSQAPRGVGTGGGGGGGREGGRRGGEAREGNLYYAESGIQYFGHDCSSLYLSNTQMQQQQQNWSRCSSYVPFRNGSIHVHRVSNATQSKMDLANVASRQRNFTSCWEGKKKCQKLTNRISILRAAVEPDRQITASHNNDKKKKTIPT